MRIALDAMGGDHAPDEIVRGAVEAADLLDKDDELILVGVQDSIESQLSSLNADCKSISVVHAPQIIGMDEAPIESLRKKRKSSIATMARMAAHDQADGTEAQRGQDDERLGVTLELCSEDHIHDTHCYQRG